MKTTAVIVTFNRYALLIENLTMLEKQTKQFDKVMIIDNHSTDGTEKIIMEKFKKSKLNIDYRYMDDNYGGAGGFYYGVKYAYEDNADFVYLMDDDGKPADENTFEIMYNSAMDLYKENKKLFLNSLVTCDGKNLSFGFDWKKTLETQLNEINNSKEDVLRDKVNPFNGTLITKELIKEIGFPRKEFFLSRDETDYMFRSKNAGALLATIKKSIYLHPKSKLQYKSIFGIATPVYDNLDKEYYYVRNLVYTYKNESKSKMHKHLLLRFATIIFYEKNKIKRVKQLFKAKKDAYNNVMGKRK